MGKVLVSTLKKSGQVIKKINSISGIAQLCVFIFLYINILKAHEIFNFFHIQGHIKLGQYKKDT